jgi:hypothetical protein
VATVPGAGDADRVTISDVLTVRTAYRRLVAFYLEAPRGLPMYFTAAFGSKIVAIHTLGKDGTGMGK